MGAEPIFVRRYWRMSYMVAKRDVDRVFEDCGPLRLQRFDTPRGGAYRLDELVAGYPSGACLTSGCGEPAVVGGAFCRRCLSDREAGPLRELVNCRDEHLEEIKKLVFPLREREEVEMDNAITVVKRPPMPGSQEWRRMMTASKIPALLGMSPWKTRAELWMECAGKTGDCGPNDADHLVWGHCAESSLASWWEVKHPQWVVGKKEVAYQNTALEFPHLVTVDRVARRNRRKHIVECKTSSRVERWADGVPADVVAQVVFQMGVSGIHSASVVAQVGGTVPVIVDIDWDAELFEWMCQEAKRFWVSIEAGDMPGEVLNPFDIPAVPVAPDLDSVDVDAEVMGRYVEALKVEAEATALRTAVEEEIKACGADAAAVSFNGKVVARRGKGRFSERRVDADNRHLLLDPDVLTPKVDAVKFAAKYPEVARLATGEGAWTFQRVQVLKAHGSVAA